MEWNIGGVHEKLELMKWYMCSMIMYTVILQAQLDMCSLQQCIGTAVSVVLKVSVLAKSILRYR